MLTPAGPVASPPFVEWSTSVDVFLDPANSGGGNVDDTRIDLSSSVTRIKDETTGAAIDCRANTGFLRDFMFNCGWYNEVAATATEAAKPKRWICSASTNSIGWPQNPEKGPVDITVKDWYTFTHTFKNVNGKLSVDLQIVSKSTNAVVKQWTLADPSDDIAKVGGSEYYWFVTLGCTKVENGKCTLLAPNFKLPIDNTKKCVKGFGCDFFQGFEANTAGWFDGKTDNPNKNPDPSRGIIERVATGTNSITSATGDFHALVSGVPIPAIPADRASQGPDTSFSGKCISYSNDKCPGTAEGAIVDANGCSDEDVDEDGDGVCNLGARVTTGPNVLCRGEDLCPGTPAKTIVNDIGCSDKQRETVCKSKGTGEKGKSTKAPTPTKAPTKKR